MTAEPSLHFGGPAVYLNSNRTPDTGLSFELVTNPRPWSIENPFEWTPEVTPSFGTIDDVGFFPEPASFPPQLDNIFDETLAGFPTQISPPEPGGATSLGSRGSNYLQELTPKTGGGHFPHGQINVNSGTCCDECGTNFLTQATLVLHAKHTKHAAYICKCGERCSRLDVLKRHIKTFQPTTTHPCPYCNKFPGSKAFTRRDHLLQHWRGHHNIEPISDSDQSQSITGSRSRMRKRLSCPHEDCPYFRSQTPQDQDPFQENNPAFGTQSELTRHLREVHSESPFGCTEPYCSRNGGRGFFREGDLLRHQKEHHSLSTRA